MTLLTDIALFGCFFSLGLGALTLLREKGYSFDMRRRSRRRDGNREGGRRSEDLVRAG